jgi:proline iminopeptidase
MIIAMDNRTFRRRSGTSRIALGADSSNFYVLGQSWGGILAMEYALKYQKIICLIISNMMASVPAYNKYAQEVLGPQLDPKVFAQIKEFEKNKEYTNPKYTELPFKYYYTEHILRMPIDEWPEVNRSFNHMNPNVYVYMQGPVNSE